MADHLQFGLAHSYGCFSEWNGRVPSHPAKSIIYPSLFRLAAEQVFIKLIHKCGGRTIVHIPQAYHNGGGACIEKGSLHAQHALPSYNLAQARIASAEYYHIRLNVHSQYFGAA